MFHQAESVSRACLTVVVSHCKDLTKKISVTEGFKATWLAHISDLESGICSDACDTLKTQLLGTDLDELEHELDLALCSVEYDFQDPFQIFLDVEKDFLFKDQAE